LGRLALMIADDHEGMLGALIRMLSSDFEITVAVKDGRYLVNAAVMLQPDVIVSDILMPRLRGFQAQQELIDRGYRIPFVFISTNSELMRRGRGCLVDKLDIPYELIAAIQAAALGKNYISRRVRQHTGLES
jgi:DNA-binding NarL/FixJ family response regulator